MKRSYISRVSWRSMREILVSSAPTCLERCGTGDHEVTGLINGSVQILNDMLEFSLALDR